MRVPLSSFDRQRYPRTKPGLVSPRFFRPFLSPSFFYVSFFLYLRKFRRNNDNDNRNALFMFSFISYIDISLFPLASLPFLRRIYVEFVILSTQVDRTPSWEVTTDDSRIRYLQDSLRCGNFVVWNPCVVRVYVLSSFPILVCVVSNVRWQAMRIDFRNLTMIVEN